jgi:hypothetical protein
MYSTLSILGKGRLSGLVSYVNHFIEEVRHKLSIQANLVTYIILIDTVCHTGREGKASKCEREK